MNGFKEQCNDARSFLEINYTQKSSQKGNIIEITVSSAYNIYSSGKYEVQ